MVLGTITGDLGAVRPGIVSLDALVTIGSWSVLVVLCKIGVVGSAPGTGAGGEPSALIRVVNLKQIQ